MKMRVDVNLELGLQEYELERIETQQAEISPRLRQAALPADREPKPAGAGAKSATRLH